MVVNIQDAPCIKKYLQYTKSFLLEQIDSFHLVYVGG